MNFTVLQISILDALVRYEDVSITKDQLAARLLIPYGTLNLNLYRLRKMSRTRSTVELVAWWKKYRSWQQP